MDELKSTVLNKYKENVIDMLGLSLPMLSKSELSRAIDYSIRKRLEDTPCELYNNHKELRANTSLLTMSDTILNNRYIVTSYGTLYDRHEHIKTPTYRVLDIFINARSKFKKEMFKYPKGSDEFKTYNMLQLLAKLDANA